jgi:segregation and condensation protein B
MKIVTTPMCEEIVKLAGIDEYVVNKFPTKDDGDLAILLSESKVEMKSIPIKINTSTQIFESIKQVSSLTGNELDDDEILPFFKDYKLCKKYLNSNFKRETKVKVYSKFLKDIVLDVGFKIDSKDYDYVIYPDYLKDNVDETENLVEIPSHNSISKNPFDKAEARYGILENLI